MLALFSFNICVPTGHGTLPLALLPLANDCHCCANADHARQLRIKPQPLKNKSTRRQYVRNIFCFESPMRMLFAA